MKIEKGQNVVLMVSEMPNGKMQTAIDIGAFPGPGAWGIVLADIVRHIARAANQYGNPINYTIPKILEHLNYELDNPTSEVTGGMES